MRLLRGSTLQIRRPFGRTLLLAGVLLIVIVGVAETSVRALHTYIPLVSSVNSNHREFEIKVHLLTTMRDQTGDFDCFFLGSSIVRNGVNPLLFEDAYREQTGEAMHCFNLGIDGSGEMAGVMVSKWIIEDYDPALLVFGISPRLHTRIDKAEVAQLPWMRYRNGEFSWEGWLLDHSTAYRYGIGLVKWLSNLQPPATFVSQFQNYQGFPNDTRTMKLPLPPEEQQRLAPSEYTLQQGDQRRLEQIMALHDPPHRTVVLVEMPVHLVAFDGYPEKRTDYDVWVAEVAALADEYGVLFLPTTTRDLVPDSKHWANFNHLNPAGAAILSAWLGREIGSAVSAEQSALVTQE
jgi:hypothetical protein